jgi:hypothetical protein
MYTLSSKKFGIYEYQDGEDSELKLKAQQILSDRINTHLTLSK